MSKNRPIKFKHLGYKSIAGVEIDFYEIKFTRQELEYLSKNEFSAIAYTNQGEYTLKMKKKIVAQFLKQVDNPNTVKN